MIQAVLRTPIGGVGVWVSVGAVVGVSFGASLAPSDPAPSDLAPSGPRLLEPDDEGPLLAEAQRQLSDYFARARSVFELPVVMTRGTPFERSVWAAIAAIPFGETRSYGEIARAVGDPGGARAVGLACNRNPVPIIVPCHRVIGANGKLVGFGGGVERKQWLLQREALDYLSTGG